MLLARRDFLAQTGGAMTAAAAVSADGSTAAATAPGDDWDRVRELFALSGDYIHMSAMLVVSHPKPVRDAIDRHRRELDANPITYLERNYRRRYDEARTAAGRYLGLDASAVALTDSTTMGVGLIYNGLRLLSYQDILTTEQDFYVTHEALRQTSERTGASLRKTPLYDRLEGITEDQIVARIAGAVTPATRVLALTWVHSSTGLKLPLRSIADAIAEINAGRDEADRVLICVDGVHGFGIEDVILADLGCDLLMAGCHKWLFGPRGTGIVAGTERGWSAVRPSIPSFTDDATWEAWLLGGAAPSGPTTAARMTPGGFKPFEHQWALVQAFELHEAIGKARVAERTRELAGQLKDGLAAMDHVTLHTPRDPRLSAGIVCFDVDGMAPAAVVRRLRERRIIASVAPYATPHVRLTPSIRNSPAEIETVLRELRTLTS
jgi:isopenicillin-N epimerase